MGMFVDWVPQLPQGFVLFILVCLRPGSPRSAARARKGARCGARRPSGCRALIGEAVASAVTSAVIAGGLLLGRDITVLQGRCGRVSHA